MWVICAVCQRFAAVADHLAEEEVHRLNRRGALVQGVDPGVADVLLDRVVLQETRSAEGLQRLGEQAVGPLGGDTFDQREQQIVEAVGHRRIGTRNLFCHIVVLVCGGVHVERSQAFGVCLLRHQAATHVGVVQDRHPRRGLVRHLGQVGAPYPAPWRRPGR